MTHDTWMERLSDLLDGSLADPHRGRCERHVAECPECTDVLRDLRAVRDRAGACAERPVPRDLWPGIAARLRNAGDPWVGRLSEYVDGELSPAERRLIERHLAYCGTCGATLNDLRRVTKRAGALDDRPDTPDLWAGIAKRIGATPPAVHPDAKVAGRIGPWRGRRLSVTVPQLLAAGIALMVTTATGVWLAGRNAGPTAAPAVAAAPAALPDEATASFVSTRYDDAVADLTQLLDRERTVLAPQTVEIIEENLAIIDRALARAQAALRQDPQSEYLREHLEQTMRQKLTLLQRATSISSSL